MGKIAFGDSWKEPTRLPDDGKPDHEGQKLTQEVAEEDMAETKEGLRAWGIERTAEILGRHFRFDKGTLDKATSMAKLKNPKVPISRITRPR